MKYVQVRRHAEKHAHGLLTDFGKEQANELKKKMPKFNLIISSDKIRAQETAFLLTGQKPIIDKRAGTPPFTPEEMEKLHILSQTHEFGIAGVIFDNPKYKKMIKEQGEKLAKLIKEILLKLPENGCALIISHDGVMVSAEKILKHASFNKAGKTFKPLQGFQVNEKGEIINLV